VAIEADSQHGDRMGMGFLPHGARSAFPDCSAASTSFGLARWRFAIVAMVAASEFMAEPPVSVFSADRAIRARDVDGPHVSGSLHSPTPESQKKLARN